MAKGTRRIATSRATSAVPGPIMIFPRATSLKIQAANRMKPVSTTALMIRKSLCTLGSNV